jgi:diguanylate cyclase (GGDEF)-like protein
VFEAESIKASMRRGRFRECADALGQWLRHAPPEDPSRLQALSLRCEALSDGRCDHDELLAAADELADAALRADCKVSLGEAACHRALANRGIGLRDQANQQALVALRLARDAGDMALQARALRITAAISTDVGDFAEARQMLDQSIACAEQSGSPSTLFWSLNNLSHIIGVEAARLASTGDSEAARVKSAELIEVAGRALALARRSTGELLQEAYALSNLADAYIVQGDVPKARTLIDAYAGLARSIGFGRLQAYALLDEVRLLRAAGQLDEAIALLSSAELVTHMLDNDDIELDRVQGLYELHKQQGRFERALHYHEQLAQAQSALYANQSVRMQRVLLARLDVESAEANAERARLEALSQRLRSELLERERDQHRNAALHDPLTGLPNRRAAEEQWDEYAARATGDGALFFAAVIDIDHFKRVNDTLGHPKGDAVLTETGRVLQALLRRHDGLYRIGGEEFLALLTDSTASSGLAACERLRAGIAAVDWSSVSPGLHVTVSIGVACRRGAEARHELLERADAALYAAKAAGRNRCVQA